MDNLKLEYLSASALKPNPRNARSHSDKQIAKIAASIAKFGFTNPILVDEDNNVICGHGRLLAANLLGKKKSRSSVSLASRRRKNEDLLSPTIESRRMPAGRSNS